MKRQHAVRGAEFFHRIKSASQSFRTDAMEQLEWKSYKSKMSQTTRQSSKPIQTLSGGTGQMPNSSLPFCQQPLYTFKSCVTDNPDPRNRSATQDVQSKRVQTAAIVPPSPSPPVQTQSIFSTAEGPDLPWQPYFSSTSTMIFAKPSHRS